MLGVHSHQKALANMMLRVPALKYHHSAHPSIFFCMCWSSQLCYQLIFNHLSAVLKVVISATSIFLCLCYPLSLFRLGLLYFVTGLPIKEQKSTYQEVHRWRRQFLDHHNWGCAIENLLLGLWPHRELLQTLEFARASSHHLETESCSHWRAANTVFELAELNNLVLRRFSESTWK